MVEETQFLGIHISNNGMEVPAERAQVFIDWTEPSSLKNLQRFLGFAN